MGYIEREAAYRFAQDQRKKETGAYSKGWNNALVVMKGALHNNDAIPAADVTPVRHGYWRWYDTTHGGIKLYVCSLCDGDSKTENEIKRCLYCPNCGARMDLKDGDGDG